MSGIARATASCVLALALGPATASAQFVPLTSQYQNPFPYGPYQFQLYYRLPQTNSIYNRVILGSPIPFATPLNRLPIGPPQMYNTYRPIVPWAGGSAVTSGYISGATSRNNLFADSQRELERAQAQATAARLRNHSGAAKDLITEQWAYERGGAGVQPVVVAPKDQPEELTRALALADDARLLSGEALNVILAAVQAAEAKGAKGPSAFLPIQVFEEVRFAGPPTADALNFLLRAGKLPFPVAFADPRLADVRDEFQRDFAAVAAPLRAGKPADPMPLAKVGFTFEKIQEAAPVVIRNLPFDDATASRQFLRSFETALGVVKQPAAQSLVPPLWVTEGSSVADLVKHMTKHKLRFGAAPAGGDSSYLALHKGLATYLFVVTQPKK